MTADEARAQQTAMRGLVSLTNGFGEIRTVAGVDLSLNDEKNEGHAIVVVLSYPDFQRFGDAVRDGGPEDALYLWPAVVSRVAGRTGSVRAGRDGS